MRTLPLLAAAVFVGLLAGPASAQNPPAGMPTEMRGTVEALDGHTLSLRSRDGQRQAIALTPTFTVLGMAKKSVDDVLTGDYVTVIGRPAPAAKMQAIEVRVYPESMRGLREGRAPANLAPGSVVTNATVASITKAADGQVLRLRVGGGGQNYSVGSDVPVLSCVRGDASLLKPGAAVYITALKRPDGSLTAAQLIAEKDGIKPPF